MNTITSIYSDPRYTKEFISLSRTENKPVIIEITDSVKVFNKDTVSEFYNSNIELALKDALSSIEPDTQINLYISSRVKLRVWDRLTSVAQRYFSFVTLAEI